MGHLERGGPSSKPKNVHFGSTTRRVVERVDALGSGMGRIAVNIPRTIALWAVEYGFR